MCLAARSRVIATYRPMIRALQQLYERHDESERALVIATRRVIKRRGTNARHRLFNPRLRHLWQSHDLLERAIIFAESRLPQAIVERVKAGTV